MADCVYIPKTVWAPYVRSLEEAASQEPLSVRHLCLAYAKDVEEKFELFHHEIPRYQKATDQLARMPFAALGKLIRRYHERTIAEANHGVNTALYALALGYSTLSDSQKKTLAFACLFHNVGNLKIPNDILHKTTPLNPLERTIYSSHAVKGANILETLSLPKEIVQTALQHHEREDGSGYPQKLRGKEISPFAKICALAEHYDELQNRMSYPEAQEKIKSESHLFDTKLVKTLLTFGF
jgi:HD-GYP domain-containing protein (c-di-GMP phosphodiesterase class II)